MVPKITWQMRLQTLRFNLRHPVEAFQYAMMTRYCDRHDLGLMKIRDSAAP